MGRLSLIKSNLELEIKGVWVEYHGIKFRVARMGNPKFSEAIRKLTRGSVDTLQTADGTMDTEVAEALNKEAFAKICLVDWADLTDDDDQPIPYSEEKSLEILQNPEYHALYTFLQGVSVSQERYQFKRIQADTGN